MFITISVYFLIFLKKGGRTFSKNSTTDRLYKIFFNFSHNFQDNFFINKVVEILKTYLNREILSEHYAKFLRRFIEQITSNIISKFGQNFSYEALKKVSVIFKIPFKGACKRKESLKSK